MADDRLEWIRNKLKRDLPITETDAAWLLVQYDAVVERYRELVEEVDRAYVHAGGTRWRRLLVWLLKRTT